VRGCLEQHRNELSPGCSAYITAMQQEEISHCGADAAQFCGEQQAQGYPALYLCIREHWYDLSDDCLEYIRDRRKTINNDLPPPIRRYGDSVCDEQVQLLCSDATGFGATVRCMHDNWQYLSEPCHEFLRSLHDAHQNHPEHGGRHGRGGDNDNDDHHDRDGGHDGGHSNHHGGHDGNNDGSRDGEHGGHDGDHNEHHNNPPTPPPPFPASNGSLPAETIREQDMAIMVDCQDDITEFCDAMNRSDIHGIEHCLRYYHDDLSRNCYETLQNTSKASWRHPDFHVVYIVLIFIFITLCCIRRRCKRREWHRRRQQQQQQQQQQQSLEMKDVPAVYNPAPQSPLSATSSYSNLAVASAVPYTGTSYEPLPVNEH